MHSTINPLREWQCGNVGVRGRTGGFVGGEASQGEESIAHDNKYGNFYMYLALPLSSLMLRL